MKNTVKIITLVISCLLLIGGIIGIGVSAEDTPSVEIYKKIISYEGAVRIAYAVDASELSDGAEIKIAFSYDENVTAPKGKLNAEDFAYVNGASAVYEIGGKSYPTVFSNGFAPVNMTKNIYAIPLIVDAGGNVLASGEVCDFSIFRYCTERFSASPSADQLELYTALLNYGAAVQEALLESGTYAQSELDKYGWADAYYVAKITNLVDGAFDSVSYECFRESDVTLNAEKSYKDRIFDGFLDADGNELKAYGADTASSWNYYNTTLALGENKFTYKYAGGKVYTWSDANGNDITLAGNGYTHPGADHAAVVFDKNSDTILSMDVVDGELTIGAPKSSSWRPLELINKNSKTGAVGKTYVFETDIMIEDDYSTAGTDKNLLQFGFNKRVDYGATEETFALFAITRNSSTSYILQYLDKTITGGWGTLATGFEFGKYYNLRIEYEITSIGTTSTIPENSSATGTVSVFIDGKLATTVNVTGYYDSIPNATFAGVGLLDRAYKGVSTHRYYFDNTYISTED